MTAFEAITAGHKIRHDLESYPSHLEIVISIIFCMLTEDFTFYFSHRFLHLPFIYPYIHKVHHEHYNTFSMSSM